jgi:hypothetical protein
MVDEYDQLNVSIEKEIKALAKAKAAILQLNLPEYISLIIEKDTKDMTCNFKKSKGGKKQ